MLKRAHAAATVVCGTLVLLWGCDCCTNSVTGTAVGSGDVVTESRPVQGFSEVAVSGAGHLIVEQTGVESLEVTAEDNILPFILSEVRGGRLLLGLQPGVSVSTAHGVRYRVTVAALSEVVASGASRVEILRVDTPELAVRLSGASSCDAVGSADRHHLDLSGASRCETGDLVSREVRASLSGASYALVRALDRLVVTASGASTLEYFGNPVVEASVSGGSIVQPAR
jgi:hypothetical protein